MPITRLRIRNFRAFQDTGSLTVGALTAVVGKNDSGKSGMLHALQFFFSPPKKGGLAKTDIHGLDEAKVASVEVSFDPKQLSGTSLKVDAKNAADVIDDYVVDDDGMLTMRVSASSSRVEKFELLVRDIDDTDLFPLFLKDHDQLFGLLQERGLPAVKAGKETNQEKRNTLRDASLAAGAGWKEEWVLSDSVEKAVRALLPEFIFFTDSARFGIGETSVQNQFKGIVGKAMSDHAEATAIEDKIRATIQEEFDKVFSRLERLTDTVLSMTASPRVSWKKAVDGIDLAWEDQFGVDLPFGLRGAGVRRLFMLAYLQYEAATELHDAGGLRYVFAIEEPEVHLHPGAQRLLWDALQDLGDLGHSVVFTTHSPVFAAAVPSDQLTLVRRTGAAAEVSQGHEIDLVDVAEELGIEASDRLVGKNHVVLVEGRTDVEFFRTVLKQLYQNGDTVVDPDAILFLQCGGVDNLDYVVTTKCIDEAGLVWAAVADSDRSAVGAEEGSTVKKLRLRLPASCKALWVLERSFLENYLSPVSIQAITGIDCLMPKYGKANDLGGNPLETRKWKKIKKNCGQIAAHMDLDALKAAAVREDGDCEWIEMFEALGAALDLS